jgi:hypothetical protein
MDEGARLRGTPRLCRAGRYALSALAAMLMVVAMSPGAAVAAVVPAPVTSQVVTAEAAVVTEGFIDVFATSQSQALQVDGQDERFPTTAMSHDEGSTRFYAHVPVADGQTVTSVTVRAARSDPSSSVTVDVRGILVMQATYDGATLTVAATANGAATYPLTVDAGGAVGDLPSAAPVAFSLSTPPQTITVSSGTLKTTAAVSVTGSPAGRIGTASSPGAAPGASPMAEVTSTTVPAPRGLAAIIDGSGSTNATTFRTVVKNGPQGATIVGDTTATPSIVLPTWAAPTDVLPRVAPAATPTVVAFTAINGTASSTVDVTVDPVGDAVVVTTARTQAGSDLQVGGTSTIPGAGQPPAPPTQVVVYARSDFVDDPSGLEPGWLKVGSAAVDTTGAFSVRARPASDTTYVQYLVQTSRGTQVSGALGR